MKNLLLTICGVLLVAVSTVGLSKVLTSKAETNNRASQPNIATPTAKLNSGWRLGAPAKHENLTVFPVISEEVAGTDEFITLDAGIRSGKVKVTEMSAAPRSPRNISP